MPIERRKEGVLASVLAWNALGAVIGAVYMISTIHARTAWLLGLLTATHHLPAGREPSVGRFGEPPNPQ